MKRLLLSLLAIGFVVINLSAYQNSCLNLFSPTALTDKEGEFALSHRFWGKVDEKPIDTFFGMNNGANIGLFARRSIAYNIEAKLGYIRDKKEYQAGISYKPTPLDFPVQAQVDVQYFSYDEPSQEDRRNNMLGVVSLQNSPLNEITGMEWTKRFTFTVNAGFDNYYQRFITGFGFNAGILEDLSILAEYSPVLDRSSASYDVRQYLYADDCYSIGLKANTYGHHFMLMLSNHDKMDFRHFSLGTPTGKDLMLGFNISRKF